MNTVSTNVRQIGVTFLLMIFLYGSQLYAQCTSNIDVSGVLTGSIGVPNASRADGAPDGIFTSDISGNSDDLFLTYQSETDDIIDATLCLSLIHI